jgi:hypothetical protein
MIVAIDNVIQNPNSAFTVAGNAITFSSAPLSGTSNIWVEYTSLITTYQGISQDPTVIGDIRATGGYLAEGDFGNSYVDGTIVDYVTGNARITTGPIDDMTFYHGGTASRSEMMKLSYAGNSTLEGGLAATGNITTTGSVGVGTASPSTFGKLAVVNGTTAVANTGIDGTTGVCYAFQSPNYGTTYQNTIDGSVSSTYSASVIAFKLASGANTTTESMRIQGQNLQFNSGYGSVATAYGCRVWVNLNGATGAINGSGNVTSVSRNGTGDYSVFFTNNMPDANYSYQVSAQRASNNNGDGPKCGVYSGGVGTGNIRVLIPRQTSSSGETYDTNWTNVSIAIFR